MSRVIEKFVSKSRSHEALYAMTDKLLGYERMKSKNPKINGELWNMIYEYLDFHANGTPLDKYVSESENSETMSKHKIELTDRERAVLWSIACMFSDFPVTYTLKAKLYSDDTAELARKYDQSLYEELAKTGVWFDNNRHIWETDHE